MGQVVLPTFRGSGTGSRPPSNREQFAGRRGYNEYIDHAEKAATAMKGDRVVIVIDAGSGTTRTYENVATRAGRKVGITHSRGVIEVAETTRGGSTVRTARFLANRV